MAVQYYWFHDPIYMNTPFDWSDPSSYTILMGPLIIERSVYKDTDGWKYKIEKDGCFDETDIPKSIFIISPILELLLSE